jgi:hypothetical protein
MTDTDMTRQSDTVTVGHVMVESCACVYLVRPEQKGLKLVIQWRKERRKYHQKKRRFYDKMNEFDSIFVLASDKCILFDSDPRYQLLTVWIL